MQELIFSRVYNGLLLTQLIRYVANSERKQFIKLIISENGRSELWVAGDRGDAVPGVPAKGRDLHQCASRQEPQPQLAEVQVRQVQEPGEREH